MIKSLLHKFPRDLHSIDLKLTKGEPLFLQGDPVAKVYLIQSGRIKLIRNTASGLAVILHIGNSGEAIAEASLFSDYYHCSAIADLPCHISSIKKQDLLQLLENEPQEMMRLLALFSQQIRDLRWINEIKNIRSAKERILHYMISKVDENKEMQLDISLKDIAQKIGLAHETFYRELKKLEISGRISRNRCSIKLNF
jgi:CRP-like cAMP-binding protein